MTKAQKDETDVKPAEGTEETPKATAKGTKLSRAEEADAIVRTYMLWAMAGGITPFIVDTIVISGVQIKMLHSLAKLYKVPFTQNMGKSVVASLAGGVGSGSISRGGLGSALKMIPLIGPIVGYVAMPVLAGASTFAIGKLFIQHFESGGTFLDFDPATVKDHFAKLYTQGKDVAANVYKAVRPGDKKAE